MITPQRQILATYMDILVVQRDHVHYRQHRPMENATVDTAAELLALLKRSEGLRADCSETVTILAHLAGMKTPWYHDGQGNTGTMLASLARLPNPSSAAVGALVVFGADRPLAKQHVGMVRRVGADPILFSHGSESGPILVRLSDLRQTVPGEVAVLGVSRL